MRIDPLSPDDTGTIAEVAGLLDAGRRVDNPDGIEHTALSYGAMLKYGWDGEPPVAWAARTDDGTLAGILAMDLPERDNTHLAWLSPLVHPEYRRRGYGTQLLEYGIGIAADRNRRVLGMDGWDIEPARAFAAAHGFEQKSVEVCRRQVMAALDWPLLDKLYDESLAAAKDYQLLRIAGPVPDELLDAVVAMTAAINDAPTDDLDIEDEIFTAERVRAFEHAMTDGWDRSLYRIVARHNDTGELGGHTVVGIEHERPEYGWQLDTSVLRAHRGHRLGLLLKIEQLRWLRETEPQLVSFDTWNAESNKHMIAVNEQLGYRVIARNLDFQRERVA